MKPPPILVVTLIAIAIVTPATAQFAEIASIVGSVIGSGLAPAAGAAGAATAAGAGAAGALGNLGTLYQLAQGALALTGTGVGIVNQASESSWFPAAVEHAVKANRDFQERLLAGGQGPLAPGAPGGGGGLLPGMTLPGLPGATGTGESSLGTEYGKNFGVDNGAESGEGDDYSDETDTPSPSLEKELQQLEKQDGKRSSENEVKNLGGLTGPVPTSPPVVAAGRPVVTVEIPGNLKKADIVDYEELLGKMWPGKKIEDLDFNVDELTETENGASKMVPALAKLVAALKESNLSKEEFLEIAKQLETNKNIGEPRENTSPVTPLKSSELGSEEQPVPEEEKKYGKNLPELRRILGTHETENGATASTLIPTVIVPSASTTTTWQTTTTVTTTPRPVTRATTVRPKAPHSKNYGSGGFIPVIATTIQPESHRVVNVHPRRIIDNNMPRTDAVKSTPPRAVPTPRPIAKGVPQRPVQLPAQAAPKQIVAATTPQPQQQQPYKSYDQQYQEYLQRYYPAYARPTIPPHLQIQQPYNAYNYYQPQTQYQLQQQTGNFYHVQQPAQQPATVPPTPNTPQYRQYPLAHPNAQGVLLTNQQPQHPFTGRK
uniref:EF-hand domain-containing protein n=1 Tax=Panagrellus redivivus TaxID=6233 RepID=A0A7E4W6M6_PANRE